MQFLIGIFTVGVAVACYQLFIPAPPQTFEKFLALGYQMPAEGVIARNLIFIAIIFVGMAFLAATNDIAVDGYYLEGLTDKKHQAAYSGYRVLAYRLAMIF